MCDLPNDFLASLMLDDGTAIEGLCNLKAFLTSISEETADMVDYKDILSCMTAPDRGELHSMLAKKHARVEDAKDADAPPATCTRTEPCLQARAPAVNQPTQPGPGNNAAPALEEGEIYKDA